MINSISNVPATLKLNFFFLKLKAQNDWTSFTNRHSFECQARSADILCNAKPHRLVDEVKIVFDAEKLLQSCFFKCSSWRVA